MTIVPKFVFVLFAVELLQQFPYEVSSLYIRWYNNFKVSLKYRPLLISTSSSLASSVPSASVHFSSKENYNETEKADYEIYDGIPLVSMNDIDKGLILEELGLVLMIADSTVNQGGKGLFISLSSSLSSSSSPLSNQFENNIPIGSLGAEDDIVVNRVDIPTGQVLCGYSKGSFYTKAQGDKCVGYAFNNVSSNAVIYNKQLMTLAEMMHQNLITNKDLLIQIGAATKSDVQSREYTVDAQNEINSTPGMVFMRDIDVYKLMDSLRYCILGHEIALDASVAGSFYADNSHHNITLLSFLNNYLTIKAMTTFSDRYFVPTHVSNIDTEVGIMNVGMYANDLQFNSQDNTYLAHSETNNEFLQLKDDGVNSNKSSSRITSNNVDVSDDFLEGSFNTNILQLVWRMEVAAADKQKDRLPTTARTTSGSKRRLINTAGKTSKLRPAPVVPKSVESLSEDFVLSPSWPVVVFSRDVSFVNEEPLEVGLTYSYDYWNALLLAQRSKQAGSRLA